MPEMKEIYNLFGRMLLGTVVGLVVVLIVYLICPELTEPYLALGLPSIIGLFMFIPLIFKKQKHLGDE